MSDGGSVTTMGFDELKRAVEDLPRTVTLALRGVAWQSSRRIQARAKAILRSKTHGTGKTAAHIVVIEEEAKKQFVVDSQGDPDRPANLPLWLERGTRFMAARPYMRPAADEEDAHYKSEMMRAADTTATKALDV